MVKISSISRLLIDSSFVSGRQRPEGLSADEVAVAVGLSADLSPSQLWQLKIEAVPTGVQSLYSILNLADRFNILLAKTWSELVSEMALIEIRRWARHSLAAWAHCYVDKAFLPSPARPMLWRCGCLYAEDVDRWGLTSWLDYQRCVIQMSLFVTGWHGAHFAYVGHKSLEMDILDLRRDDELIAHLAASAATFWDHIEKKTEPSKQWQAEVRGKTLRLLRRSLLNPVATCPDRDSPVGLMPGAGRFPAFH